MNISCKMFVLVDLIGGYSMNVAYFTVPVMVDIVVLLSSHFFIGRTVCVFGLTTIVLFVCSSYLYFSKKRFQYVSNGHLAPSSSSACSPIRFFSHHPGILHPLSVAIYVCSHPRYLCLSSSLINLHYHMARAVWRWKDLMQVKGLLEIKYGQKVRCNGRVLRASWSV